MRRKRVIAFLMVPAGLGIAGSAFYLMKHHGAGNHSGGHGSDPHQAADSHDPRRRDPASADAHHGTGGAGDLAHEPDSDAACGPVEVPGRGPLKARHSQAEWAQVMAVFHDLKKSYQGWLETRTSDIGEKTAKIMSHQMKELRLERPPTPGEPDLAWRGIGAWSFDKQGTPIVRIGDGFVSLHKKAPGRARFELARLMAQAWSPCELKKLQVTQPWDELTQCVGAETADKSCAPGAVSDAGWAVSTALALQVSKPGCKVPAFEGKSAQACLWQMPFKHQWKEARR